MCKPRLRHFHKPGIILCICRDTHISFISGTSRTETQWSEELIYARVRRATSEQPTHTCTQPRLLIGYLLHLGVVCSLCRFRKCSSNTVYTITQEKKSLLTRKQVLYFLGSCEKCINLPLGERTKHLRATIRLLYVGADITTSCRQQQHRARSQVSLSIK